MVESRCDGEGVCAETEDDCRPYTCDPAAVACRESCASNEDCAAGNACDVELGVCSSSAVCDGDHLLSQPDGGSLDCFPYRCTDIGLCLTACASTADCAPGTTCNASGQCEASAEADSSGEEGGCGCRIARPSPPARVAAAWLGLGALLVVAVRRRRGAAVGSSGPRRA
jgi:MYXO-CTERM domain-containing protein